MDGLSAWMSALALSAWVSNKEPVLNLQISRPIVINCRSIATALNPNPDQEIKFTDPDFAACVDYNRLLSNAVRSFLNCSHELGPSPTVAEVETNGSTGTTPFT